MNNVEFDKILQNQLGRIHTVLGDKADEYASDVDRLHNFKIAATLQAVSVPEAIVNLMSKHTVSIFDMVRSGRTYTPEQWDEKITDHINYLILLRASVDPTEKA